MFVFLSFIVLFGFYVFNMAPSLTVGDAGEFQAASTILGVAHAPGYPLFSLIGKISQTIFPYGSLAYRVNLTSALFGSATSALFGAWVYIFLKKFYREESGYFKAVLAFFSSVFFASTLALFRSSIQTEVFTLNSFFAALVAICVFRRWNNEKNFPAPTSQKNFAREYYLIFFILGFASTNHQTIVLVIPPVLWAMVAEINSLYSDARGYCGASMSRSFAFKKLLHPSMSVGLAVFFLLGFSLNLYLLVRARKDPALNVGNPSDFYRFMRVIRRADYGTLKLTVGQKSGYDIKSFIGQSRRMISGMVKELTLAGALLALCGTFLIFRAKNGAFPSGIFIVLFYIFSVPFFIFMGNLPFDAESEGILERFYVMGTLPLAFMAVAGAALGLKEFLKDEKISLLTSSLILAGLAAGNLVKNFDACHWRKNFLAYDYGTNVLRSVPPGGALFMDGGDDTFYTTAYLVFAEGRRRDVSLFDRGGVVFKSPYGHDFRSGFLSREEKESRRKEVERDFARRRAVVFSTFNKDVMSPQHRVRQAGILYWAPHSLSHSGVTENSGDGLFEIYPTRNYLDYFDDYRSRSLQPIYSYMKISKLFSEQKSPLSQDTLQKAVEGFDYCLKRWPDVVWLSTNIKIELSQAAYRAFEQGAYDAARVIYERFLDMNPSDAGAWTNLGVVYERIGKESDALFSYQKAIDADPRHALAYYNKAVIYWRRKEWSKVVENFKKVVALEPSNETALRYLKRAEAESVGGTLGR